MAILSSVPFSPMHVDNITAACAQALRSGMRQLHGRKLRRMRDVFLALDKVCVVCLTEAVQGGYVTVVSRMAMGTFRGRSSRRACSGWG